jgi:toxin ParE1/3/4
MVKVVWTERALAQLERAIAYIKTERGVSYATIVLEKILEKTSALEMFPRRGQEEILLKHKKAEYRYLVAFSYKVIYKVLRDRVVISRVFHAARDPKKLKGI